MRNEMYKILVVDDEKLLRQGLIHITNWMDHGYIITGEAANGAEALQFMEANCPDIIITDIVMPVMNGIDLIRKIKEDHSNVQVIVLSSYSEFQYVREALKLGAVDYILKQEIEPDSLLKVLEKARLKIDEGRNSSVHELSHENTGLLENLFLSLLTSNSIDKASFFKCLSNHGISLNEDHLQLILFCPRNLSPWPEFKGSDSLVALKDTIISFYHKELNPFIFFSSEKIIALLINNIASGDSILESACIRAVDKIRLSRNLDYVSVMSEKYCGIEQTRNVYFKTLKVSQFCFYDNSLRLIKYSYYEGKIVTPLTDYKHISSLLEKLDFKSLYESNTSFINETLEKGMYFEIYELKKMLVEIFNYMIFRLGELGLELEEIKDNRFEYIKKIENAKSMPELMQEFKSSIDAAAAGVNSSERAKYSELITGVINYINRNFQDNISLSSAASFLHVNKNYLCELFKHQTGENFSDFLIKVRIEKAKEILKSSNTSVSSVGEMVGYPNSSYFVQLFKKTTGMTPLEFSRRFAK